MIKRKNEIFLIFFLLLITLAISGQKNCEDICYTKKDSVTGDINGDNYKDLIIVYLEDAGNNNKVEFFLFDSNGGYTKRTKEWLSAGHYVDLKADKGFLIYTLAYGRRDLDYTTLIYKYVEHYDDWFLYGFLKHEMSIFDELPGWTDPKLQGINIASAQVFGVEEISDSISNLLINQSTCYNLFISDYFVYCDEYKTKKYEQTPNHDMYKTLDYLNYVEINNGTVQKYNDIGFFLLEAGKCQEAIYILENVVYAYPQRIVAYLNLGDAYSCNGDTKEAKAMYKNYIELMENNGMESKIPTRLKDYRKLE